MNHRYLLAAFAAVGLACSSSAQPVRESDMTPPRLASARVAQAPPLNGVGGDEVWKAAVPLRVIARRPLPPNEGASAPVTIRSVHTDTQIFFLVTWEDSTESVSHKTWVWNANEQTYDQGDDREDMFALAFEHTGPFDGDMRAKGAWSSGAWTLELPRRLETGNPDDTALDPRRSYNIAVAPFDHTGEMDKASGVIELAFVRSAASNNFESDEPGAVPAGFSTARTGRGDPAEWVVREETNPPSGRRVVAQISDDSTSYRLPLLVYDDLTAADVDVSVRFKPVSGRIDQGAGIVWRYQDEDNYYVARANALEDNVVAYKVEKGKRSNLGVKGAGSAYGVETEIHSGQWNSLRVVAEGGLFEIYSNDGKLFEVEDATFAEPGQVGLWTKADSVTEFDDLTVVQLDRRAQ
jgi:hypothetical protein